MTNKKKLVKKATPKKAVVKKAAVKKTPMKKAAPNPLNSKTAIADLKKLHTKLAKLKGETIQTLAEIAKKEAAIAEVLDVNVATFDERGCGVPPVPRVEKIPTASVAAPIPVSPASTPFVPPTFADSSSGCPLVNPNIIVTASNGLPQNAVAYRYA